jgi:hypothetical protein
MGLLSDITVGEAEGGKPTSGSNLMGMSVSLLQNDNFAKVWFNYFLVDFSG